MAVVECPACGTLLEFVADDEALAADPPEMPETPGTVDWIDTLLGGRGYYWTTLTDTKSH